MLSLVAAAVPSHTPTGIVASYEVLVDRHISTIMPLFLSDELNAEWNTRLSSQRLINTRDLGQLVHQEYALPWPLATRDLLMKCHRNPDHRRQKVISECSSVTHPSAPVSDRNVRLSISATRWEVTPEPGDRTRLSLRLELPASATMGVPKAILNYCQTKSLKESVTSLLSTVDRLHLPPDLAFVGWGRTRAQAASATASYRAEGVHAITSTGLLSAAMYAVQSVWGSMSSLVVAVLLAYVLVHGGSVGVLRALLGRSAASAELRWGARAPEASELQAASPVAES